MAQKTIKAKDSVKDAFLEKSNDNFDELYQHEAASDGVHGANGAVVGEDNTQTLSNKTLSSPAFSGSAQSALDMGSHKLTSVTDPTESDDACTKDYADQLAFSTALPDQSGNSGYLKTDGSSASWSGVEKNDAGYGENDLWSADRIVKMIIALS